MGVKGKARTTELSVSIGRLKLANPVMVASGTFGYAEEYKELVQLKAIGAIVTKSITTRPYEGNPPPRLCETAAGMLNAIGLQNEGVDEFIKNRLPFLKRIGTAIIVSIAGKTRAEYEELARKIDKTAAGAIEVNVSCPNIRCQGSDRLFAQDAKATSEIIRIVKKQTKKTIIAKLSPNVTDITEIARAAESSGADAVSLINTVLGMGVDVKTKRPALGNVTGGLSGPAIKPVALRMVWEAYNSIKIPIVGVGGIMDTEDAIEFFISGATAIQVGTGNFVNPGTATQIIDGLKIYLKKNKLKSIKGLTGTLKI